MAKRIVLLLAVVGLVLGTLGAVKLYQIRAAIAEGASFQPPPQAVTTVRALQEHWPAVISAIGTVTAVHGVTVSADLAGVVESISFDSGHAVRKGEILVALDTRQERAQLAAAEAQLELAHLSLDRIRGLQADGIAAQADLDRAAAEHDQAQARVAEIEATIERKTIRAPFDGLLGIRMVNLGQYLRSGDPVVPLQSLDPIYVNFAVPQQEVGRLRRGARVLVVAEGVGGDGFAGQITAIDSVVDVTTRNIEVQATLANPGGVLRPGMFVDTEITRSDGASSEGHVVALPASAISFAPYGNSVFVVEDLKSPDGKLYRGVRQQFVKLGASRGDLVAVLSGVSPGSEIVSSGAFKLRNGAAVLVNNEVQPSSNPAPQPEDS